MANEEVFDFIICGLNMKNFAFNILYHNLIYFARTFFSSFDFSLLRFLYEWKVYEMKKISPFWYMLRAAAVTHETEAAQMKPAKYIFYLHVLKAGERRDFYRKLRFKSSLDLNMFFSYFTTHLGMTVWL